MEFTSRKAEAASDQAVPERLAILAEDADVAVQRIAAKNLRTPQVALERLSHSPDRAVRRSVALNSNTPKETLLKLATQFPGDFFRNPAFDWLLLEDPDLVINLGHGVLKNILKRPDCPESFMNWAVKWGSEQEKLAVAMNANAAENLLRALIDQGGLPGDAAKGHERLKCDATLAEAEQVFSDAVKSSLAELSVTDAKALWRRGCIGAAQWLALSLGVRLTVPGRGGWTVPLQAAYLSRGDAGALIDVATLAIEGSILEREGLALSPLTPPHTLAILARDTAVNVRVKVARNLATPASSLRELVDDANKSVRESLALNEAAPLECLGQLATDVEEVVRWAVASNELTPQAELQALASDPEGRVVVGVARNLSTPPKVLQELALVQTGYVRSAVASNRATPPTALQELALDQDVWIRSDVASNPSTPPAVLQVLSLDDTKTRLGHCAVRLAVAKNPLADTKLLEKLALDQDVEVRVAVGANLASPSSLLEQLSTDNGWTKYAGPEVRLAVAKNPNTASTVLQALALDQSIHWSRGAVVRQAVAGNPFTPPTVLSELSFDSDKLVLVALARNPATTTETLEALATNRNVNLSAAVAGNPKTPLVALQRLARIKDFKVMDGLAKNPECPFQLLSLSTALRWRHDLVKLTKSLPDAVGDRVQNLPQDETISEIFRKEGRHLSSSPHESIIAKLTGADTQQDVLELQSEHTRSAARSSVRAVRLRGLRHRRADPLVLVKAHRSTDWQERLAIAGNPAAPLSVIEALAKDPHRLVALCAQATAQVKADETNRQTGTLGDESLHFNCVPIVQEVSSRLRAREDESETQQLVDTPWWNFLTPLQRNCSAELNQEPHALTASTSLPHSLQIKLLEAFALELPHAVARGCTQSTAELLKNLAHHVDEGVRTEVAESQFTPADTLEFLYKDKSVRVRIAIAGKPSTPADVLTNFAKDKEVYIREQVAGNSSTPLAALEELSVDPSVFVRKCVAENRSAPLALRQDLLDKLCLQVNDHGYRDTIFDPLTSKGARESAIELLVRSDNVNRRSSIAMSTEIPAKFLTKLGFDADQDVRKAVAGNPNTPSETLRLLAQETSIRIRTAIAGNSTTPVDILERYSLESDWYVLKAVAFNLSTPEPLRNSILQTLSAAPETDIRRDVARHELTPLAVLRNLAADSNIQVLKAVAENPTVPANLLETLTHNTSLQISLFRNQATSIEAKLRLIESMHMGDDPYMRKVVAESSLTPAQVLERLSSDSDVWVRNAVAQNPVTLGGTLVKLAGHGFWALRLNAIHNPSFPPNHREAALTAITNEIENALAPAPPMASDYFASEDFVVPLRALGLMPDEHDRKAISRATKSKDWLQRAATTLCRGVLPGELRRLMEDEVDVVKLLATLRLKQLDVTK